MQSILKRVKEFRNKSLKLFDFKSGKCGESCFNGNCDDSGQCVCDQCWEGVQCNQLGIYKLLLLFYYKIKKFI